MNARFTKKASEALDASLSFARELGHTYIGSEHLLLGLLSVRESVAFRVLSGGGAERRQITEQIVSEVGKGTASVVSARDMTPMTRTIIEESASVAARAGSALIGTEHLLFAIVSENDCFANKVLRDTRVSVADMRAELLKYTKSAPPLRGEASRGSREREEIAGCPVLSKYAKDLCRACMQGRLDPVIGRERETERIIQILSRRTKNNPCLIGEAGVGKTAVVEGLALQMVSGGVPEPLRSKTVVSLDISSVVAGAKYRGEFEERMKSIMDEVSREGNIILFIDEIHVLVGAGGAEGAVDAANIIKPALARGELQVIGATTAGEYRAHIEKDSALERRFQAVSVGEPTKAEAVEILKGLRSRYEAHHDIEISDEAIEAAVELSVRYIGDRYLPDKAIDLMDEAASKLRIQGNSPSKEALRLREEAERLCKEKEAAIIGEDYERAAILRDREKSVLEKEKNEDDELSRKAFPVLTKEHIADIVTEWTGIPVRSLSEGEARRLADLEDLLQREIIGQERAVKAVASAIRRNRTGLCSRGRPIGSFIFIGPTGVGKTALAKALAEAVFGSEKAMIRLDMSEYMERHAVAKLIGSPPGYVGYGEGGQLTRRVRRSPYCVVLFDEIEKAHPDVFNILLQILDEGVLTDSEGRRADFRNTVVIITSNAGSDGASSAKAGFLTDGDNGFEASAKKALKTVFSPEFLNRIDETVVFERLSAEDIKKIARIFLARLSGQAREKGIELEFSESALRLVSEEGYDPAFGARHIRRAVVRLAEDPLAVDMLSGRLSAGDRAVAEAENGRIVYRVDKG